MDVIMMTTDLRQKIAITSFQNYLIKPRRKLH